MRVPFGKPIIENEEIAAVIKVLQGPILVHGPFTEEFELSFASFTQAPHAISVSSCTAGMHSLYFALGLGPGDEVVVPAQTHVATAHAVELTGAKAIFVDSETKSGNVDLGAIEAALTPNTKAIAIVHYLGVPVDMPKVVKLAKRHNLFVLEDCALASGTRLDGVHAGLHGDAGVFSFYPVKHITTAEGGMIILKDAELASKLRLIRAFGVDRTHGDRVVPGFYDVKALGFNYRMSEIHAAIGIEQVKKLPEFLVRRYENYERLKLGLSNVDKLMILPQPVNERYSSSHYCLGILLDESIAAKRVSIMKKLREKGVGSSVYYPHPVPRMSYYKTKYGYDPRAFHNAALLSDTSIALPVGQHLTLADMDYISDSIKKIWKELSVGSSEP